MKPTEDIAQIHINVNNESVRILANEELQLPGLEITKEVLVDPDELIWHSDEMELVRYLTLEEIAQQLIAKGYSYPFHVWTELGLSGTIYMYGNYNPPTWVEHGKTKGYA